MDCIARKTTPPHLSRNVLICVESSRVSSYVFFSCVPEERELRWVHAKYPAIGANPFEADCRSFEKLGKIPLAALDRSLSFFGSSPRALDRVDQRGETSGEQAE
jgi:hypothetical protein